MACGFTPVPEPPALDPPDLDEITLGVDPILPPAPEVFFDVVGGPGAAEPGAMMWIVNIDLFYPPWESLVGDDGSFQVEVLGDTGQELRLQLRSDDLRSVPVDVVLGSLVDGASMTRVERQACVVMASELNLGEVSSGGVASGEIVVENHCSEEIVVDRTELRNPTPWLDVTSSMPLSIAPGSASEIEVSFSPSERGDVEEILSIIFSSPFSERRPLTVFGTSL